MRFIAAIVLVVITIGGAAAQERQAEMMGVGTKSCADFAQDYRKAPQLAQTVYFVWAEGFMSGLNMIQLALKKPMHDLAAWSISDQQAHLKVFCDQRPLLPFAYAVESVFKSLPELPPQSK